MCCECGSTFTAQSLLVKKNCAISNDVKAKILIDSSQAQSVQDISVQNSVSEATTQRLITK